MGFFFLLTLKVLRRDAIFLLALPVVNVENAPEILLPEVPLLEKKRMQTSQDQVLNDCSFSSNVFRIRRSVSPASLCWPFHPETHTARWSPGTEPGPARSGRTGSPTHSEQTTGTRLLDRRTEILSWSFQGRRLNSLKGHRPGTSDFFHSSILTLVLLVRWTITTPVRKGKF